LLDEFLGAYGPNKQTLEGLARYFGERGKFGNVPLEAQVTAENNMTRLWRNDKDAFVRAIQWLGEYTGHPELAAEFAGPEVFNPESAVTPFMRDMSHGLGKKIEDSRGATARIINFAQKVWDSLTSSPFSARHSATINDFVQRVMSSPATQLGQQQVMRGLPGIFSKIVGEPKPRTQ